MTPNRSRRLLNWLVLVPLLLLVGRGLAQTAPIHWPQVLSSSGFTVPVASGVFYSHFGVITSDDVIAMLRSKL